MPDAAGNIRSAFFSISDAEYDRIFGCPCDCDGPCDVCQESRCERYGGAEPCRCDKGGETADEPGW